MTNKERQKSLDKQKWERGIEVDYNPSGTMYYCSSCKTQMDTLVLKRKPR